jgi:hypothetical protein
VEKGKGERLEMWENGGVEGRKFGRGRWVLRVKVRKGGGI